MSFTSLILHRRVGGENPKERKEIWTKFVDASLSYINTFNNASDFPQRKTTNLPHQISLIVSSSLNQVVTTQSGNPANVVKFFEEIHGNNLTQIVDDVQINKHSNLTEQLMSSLNVSFNIMKDVSQ